MYVTQVLAKVFFELHVLTILFFSRVNSICYVVPDIKHGWGRGED